MKFKSRAEADFSNKKVMIVLMGTFMVAALLIFFGYSQTDQPAPEMLVEAVSSAAPTSSSSTISPQERFSFIERGYSGGNDYAIVVKDSETAKEVFVLTEIDVFRQLEKVTGMFRFMGWSQDGQYFWVKVSEASAVNGWVRIDAQNWSYEVYESPEGIRGGYPLDINTGWVPLVPGSFWAAGEGDEEWMRQERKEQGQNTSSLYLYNVVTKEQMLVHAENDPVWSGWPIKWLDAETLEYTLPDKTKNTFVLPGEGVGT